MLLKVRGICFQSTRYIWLMHKILSIKTAICHKITLLLIITIHATIIIHILS